MIDNQYFYTPSHFIDLDHGQLVLAGDEYHHCVHVLRKRNGDRFYVVDGRGREFTVTAAADRGDGLVCRIDECINRPRETAKPVVLIQALLKKDRMEWVTEKATELGISHLVPVMTRRTDVSTRSFHVERAAKIALSAMKQSRRSVLPQIDDVRQLADVISVFPFAYVAHEDSDAKFIPVDGSLNARVLVVGPEGGFTDEEIRMMQTASWRTISLGRRRLRAETAAIVGLSYLTLGLEN